MSHKRPFHLASAAVLALVSSQAVTLESALATESQPAVPPAPTAVTPEPMTSPKKASEEARAQSPAELARTRAEERRAAMAAERERRYEELRASAAELGLKLPEAPPWKSVQSGPPTLTDQTQASSPEARWQRMRADAANRGIGMPETPPWVEARKRRQAIEEQFARYREIVEQMTDEEREAAQALFAGAPMRPRPARPHFGPGCGRSAWGYPGPYQGEPLGTVYPPLMPYYETPGFEQGPPPPPKATPN